MKEFLERNGIVILRKYFKNVREDTLQFFLDGILDSHFDAYREVRTGDGLIDHFIIGPDDHKIIIETKMSDDEDYLDGIEIQLPEYLEREHSRTGFFIIFYIDGSSISIEDMRKELRSISTKHYDKYFIRDIIIDLRERPTPSKQKSYAELRDIKGIGPKTARKLVKANIKTLKTLVDTPIEDILKKTSISKNTLIGIKKRAKELVDSNDITK